MLNLQQSVLPLLIAFLLISGCNTGPAQEDDLGYWPKSSTNNDVTDPQEKKNSDDQNPSTTGARDDNPSDRPELSLSETVPELDVSTVTVHGASDSDEKKVIDLQELMNQGKHEEAISKLKSAIVDSPRNAELHYYLGVVYHRSADFHAALPYLNKSLELNPEDLRVLRERSTVHIRLENHADAIADLTKILELQPKSARDLVQRAMIYMRARDYLHARPDLARAIEIDPTIAEAYYAQCLINLKDRQINDARQDLANAEKHKLPADRLAELKQFFAKSTASPNGQ